MNINKEVLRLAFPSIFANITVPLVGIVDIAIAGHISDASAIGGIAIGTMLFDLLYWNFGFLRVGTGGLTAQAFGRKDDEGAVAVLSKGIRTSLKAALIILLLQWLFVTIVLSLTPCSEEVSHFAKQYFYIRIWAAPATLSLMVFKGWFIGMQDTVSAMVCDVTVNVVNMIASFALAVYTPLGAIGVAHGTLIAQYSGLVAAIILLTARYRHLLSHIKAQFSAPKSQRRKVSSYRRLNITLFIRSLCFMGIYIGFTVITSAYGDTALALGAIMMKLFMLVSFLVDGFAYAGEALVGRFVGEGNRSMIIQSTQCISVWTLFIAIAFTMLFIFAGEPMVCLMTDDSAIINASAPFQPWLVTMPFVACYAFMWDGVFVGATRGKDIMYCMICAAAGFFLTYFMLYRIIGIHAVYAALLVHFLVRSLYLTLRFPALANHTPQVVKRK